MQHWHPYCRQTYEKQYVYQKNYQSRHTSFVWNRKKILISILCINTENYYDKIIIFIDIDHEIIQNEFYIY